MLRHIFFNASTGQVLAQAITDDMVRPEWFDEERNRLARQESIKAGSIVIESQPGHTPLRNPLVEMIDNKWQIKETPDDPILYLHLCFNGGTPSPTGTRYLKNDGLDTLQVHAELRDGLDPYNSGVVTTIDGNEVSGVWALELADVGTGRLADAFLVRITAGIFDFSYTTNIPPCEVAIFEERLQCISGYRLKLPQPVCFKIVRSLS